jgi:site-specific recombinase XerC
MHQLTYELKHLADTYREGSYATQSNRRHMLMQMGEQLVAAGYKKMHAGDLKGRHVTALLAQWTAQALSPDTIRNRLAVVRWWAVKVQKVAILPKDNASYGLPKRQRVARTSKAREIPPDRLAQVRDRYVRMSLQLQRPSGCAARSIKQTSPGRPWGQAVLQAPGPKVAAHEPFPFGRRPSARSWTRRKRWRNVGP